MKGKYHTEEIKKSLLSVFRNKHWKVVDKKKSLVLRRNNEKRRIFEIYKS